MNWENLDTYPVDPTVMWRDQTRNCATCHYPTILDPEVYDRLVKLEHHRVESETNEMFMPMQAHYAYTYGNDWKKIPWNNMVSYYLKVSEKIMESWYNMDIRRAGRESNRNIHE